MWVIMNRLTNSAHFLAVRMTFTLEVFCRLYIREIVRLQGVPVSIVSDRDPKFIAHFLGEFLASHGDTIGDEHRFSSLDKQSVEEDMKTLEDMLRTCVLDVKGSWEEDLPLVEFAYNNSYQASIQMAPYEALYGRPCRSLWSVGRR